MLIIYGSSIIKKKISISLEYSFKQTSIPLNQHLIRNTYLSLRSNSTQLINAQVTQTCDVTTSPNKNWKQPIQRSTKVQNVGCRFYKSEFL